MQDSIGEYKPYSEMTNDELYDLLGDMDDEKAELSGRVPWAEWLAVSFEDDVITEAAHQLYEEIFRR